MLKIDMTECAKYEAAKNRTESWARVVNSLAITNVILCMFVMAGADAVCITVIQIIFFIAMIVICMVRGTIKKNGFDI